MSVYSIRIACDGGQIDVHDLSEPQIVAILDQMSGTESFSFAGREVNPRGAQYRIVRFDNGMGAARQLAALRRDAEQNRTVFNEADAILAHGIDVTTSFNIARKGGTMSAGMTTTDLRKVFVVHGRNARLRDGLFDFLRALGLRPEEWSESLAGTGIPSPYVGQVLDNSLAGAAAIIVLMTPDDEGCLKKEFWGHDEPEHERQLTGQARLNVIFEAGMAIGRYPQKTILVEIGKLRPFSDVLGRHMLRLSNDGQRRNDLVTRLRTAGCEVSTAGSDWMRVGDFS